MKNEMEKYRHRGEYLSSIPRPRCLWECPSLAPPFFNASPQIQLIPAQIEKLTVRYKIENNTNLLGELEIPLKNTFNW